MNNNNSLYCKIDILVRLVTATLLVIINNEPKMVWPCNIYDDLLPLVRSFTVTWRSWYPVIYLDIWFLVGELSFGSLDFIKEIWRNFNYLGCFMCYLRFDYFIVGLYPQGGVFPTPQGAPRHYATAVACAHRCWVICNLLSQGPSRSDVPDKGIWIPSTKQPYLGIWVT